MSTVEDRLRRLEDLEEIRDITARYANATNRGYGDKTIDWETLGRIYTEDAHWCSAFMGMDVTGRDAIVETLRSQEGRIDAAIHSFTNPVIDLHLDEATGEWSMPIGSVHDGADRAIFLAARFGYRRTPDGWRICSVDVDYVTSLVLPATTPNGREEG